MRKGKAKAHESLIFLRILDQIRCKFKFFFLIFQKNRNFFIRKCFFFAVSQSFLVSLRQNFKKIRLK